jgi:DNA polymerase-3 subunit gamma/tau
MARVLAKAVNCLAEDPAVRPDNTCSHCLAVNEGRFLDLIEIDAASHTSVDDVRDLRDRIAFAPNEGRYKVYIVDEVHRFSGAAFDALLKTIEEPPAHAIFILATTEVHKVPQTILSRCQRFDFRRIPVWEIVQRLGLLAEAEGLQVDQPALELIARQATGSLRDAISLFDQLITQPGDALTLELAQAILGTAASQTVQDLTETIVNGDGGSGLALINTTLDSGTDPRQLGRQMVEYLRLVMVVQTGGTALAEMYAAPEQLAIAVSHAERYARRPLLEAIRFFNEAASETRSGWQPQLPLEIALMQSINALYAPAVEVAPQPAPASPAPTAPAPQAPVRQATSSRAPKAPPPPASKTRQAPVEIAPPVVQEEAMEFTGDALSMADVHARWGEVLGVIQQLDTTKMIGVLVGPQTPGSIYSVDGNIVTYQVPGEMLRDKIEVEETRMTIEKALEQVFGMSLKFRARVQSNMSGAAGADDVLAGDSLSAFAVNELGGKVKRVQKK